MPFICNKCENDITDPDNKIFVKPIECDFDPSKIGMEFYHEKCADKDSIPLTKAFRDQ